jgi:hypothetical protein
MLCETCKQQDATVHITEVVETTSQQIKHHLCASCAELFQSSDVVQRMLRRLPMVKLRVIDASPQRTVVNVIGGRHDGETWNFVTGRLLELRIQPFSGEEVEIQDDEGYIDWLKGNRGSPLWVTRKLTFVQWTRESRLSSLARSPVRVNVTQ